VEKHHWRIWQLICVSTATIFPGFGKETINPHGNFFIQDQTKSQKVCVEVLLNDGDCVRGSSLVLGLACVTGRDSRRESANSLGSYKLTDSVFWSSRTCHSFQRSAMDCGAVLALPWLHSTFSPLSCRNVDENQISSP
jgi:hypothetical protein